MYVEKGDGGGNPGVRGGGIREYGGESGSTGGNPGVRGGIREYGGEIREYGGGIHGRRETRGREAGEIGKITTLYNILN